MCRVTESEGTYFLCVEERTMGICDFSHATSFQLVRVQSSSFFVCFLVEGALRW